MQTKRSAVPREKYRATARLAIVLGQVELLVGRDVELALHHAVGPAEVNQVGLIVLAQAKHDRGDRLAQAGFGRRVVVGDVQPLPFDEHPGSDRVGVGPHQLGLDAPVAAELKCQPVLAVAQVSGERGRFARANDQDVGQRVADQIDGGQRRRARGSRAEGQGLPSRSAFLHFVPRRAR